ncbi:MAG: tetratricopeptide repeat protein [Treponema sp.]|jgi:tetratricopeptide (TPR) repeat protein|nr:tetratricopeptide repeat protein [Treponema sp.]
MKTFCAALLLLVFSLLTSPVQAQTYVSASTYYEQGRMFMSQEDWYSAVESLLECLRINSAHAEASAALAECYYELSEFDEALTWVRKARSLSRGNLALTNLEAFTLIALGQLDTASSVINDVLAREPYNREALFAASELDIARGRAGDAVMRYQEAVHRYPDDRRLLVSLALVLGSLGETESARTYIARAIAQHPTDYQVYYYAAYLESRAGSLTTATRYAESALHYQPNYAPARSLLASLRYRAGQFEDASRLADEAIASNRQDIGAWYLKGISYIRLGRNADAITILSTAALIDPNDEFIRVTLEELLISYTNLEDSRRAAWASWHFNRARDFKNRNFIEQALFEYRRGLRLNPYAADRREYADLLRVQGYPARYLEELRFMQGLGLGDRSLNDAVEAYGNLLDEALYRRWNVNPVDVSEPHWNLGVFSIVSQSSFYHVDAGVAASAYIKDILLHERNISPMELEPREASYSQAFRHARESGADYFLIISVTENERDIAVTGELFVGRTGAPAATFTTYRTGSDRLRNAVRGIVDQLVAALPFRAELLQYHAGIGLIDKGRLDGVKVGTVYDVVKKGAVSSSSEGVGLSYAQEEVVGTLMITTADEEVSSGTITRKGFFDRISAGDEVILQVPISARAADPAPDTRNPIQRLLRLNQPETATTTVTMPTADPELRTLLRTLR